MLLVYTLNWINKPLLIIVAKEIHFGIKVSRRDFQKTAVSKIQAS